LSTTVAFNAIANTSGRREKPDTHAVLAVVRYVLEKHGLHESVFGEQAGFVLTIENRDEVSLELSDTTDGNLYAPGTPALRCVTAHLLQCCATLVGDGYSITLIATPQVLALYVRAT
jgi:hypothetical protein